MITRSLLGTKTYLSLIDLNMIVSKQLDGFKKNYLKLNKDKCRLLIAGHKCENIT